MIKKIPGCIPLILILPFVIMCKQTVLVDKKKDTTHILWYKQPASQWSEALPLGNGRLAAMVYGGIKTEHYQINEESLWAGCPTNPLADNFRESMNKLQKMVLAGEYAAAQDFGIKNLTASPTSFRPYKPFADLLIHMKGHNQVTGYRRELDMSTGISKVIYQIEGGTITRESFISAVDDMLCIRISSSGNKKIDCTVGLQRLQDAKVIALPKGEIHLDGQIIDFKSPDAYDDNPGGSGPGGKHMRFAGRLLAKVSDGNLQPDDTNLVVENAQEVILLFTAATDYNLSLLNFDTSIDPGEKAGNILEKAQNKSWAQLKSAHIKEHSNLYNQLNLNFGRSLNDTLPTDRQIEAFQNGSHDPGLIAQMFQFGRYLLMSSSRRPAILPANLQGKWNEKEWAPWEADYHLNVNLQMNYWLSDVANLSVTNEPLIDWMGQLAAKSKPYAPKMYGANGWFCCHASNPLGRVTPSASTHEAQFINGVLDPLAGAWIMMNLWDHYTFTQDKVFLRRKLYPLLRGACEFILDVLIPDATGMLQFVPSTSPENSYIAPASGQAVRITATSTYHLSIIKALFDVTLEASEILDSHDPVYERIKDAQKRLPPFLISDDGCLMEWQEDFEEAEPGHRHLSHLLGVHPFSLITQDQPALFDAARKSMENRINNGQGKSGIGEGWDTAHSGWSTAHAIIMYSRFYEGDKALAGLESLIKSFSGTLLNAHDIFQIDANFGITSGIAEMLLQSHLRDKDGNYIMDILPALPMKLSEGKISGIKGRGGFELSIEWSGGNLVSVKVKSLTGNTLNLRYKDKMVSKKTKTDKTYSFKASDFELEDNKTM